VEVYLYSAIRLHGLHRNNLIFIFTEFTLRAERGQFVLVSYFNNNNNNNNNNKIGSSQQ